MDLSTILGFCGKYFTKASVNTNSSDYILLKRELGLASDAGSEYILTEQDVSILRSYFSDQSVSYSEKDFMRDLISSPVVKKTELDNRNISDLFNIINSYSKTKESYFKSLLGFFGKAYNKLKEDNEALSDEITDLKYELDMRSIDSLTGLIGKNEVYEKYIEYLDSKNVNYSVIMIDLDKFKSVNDTYGHDFGDDVLKGYAGVVKSIIRKTDKAFRYGGEELVVVLEDTSLAEAYTVANRIRKQLEVTPFYNADTNSNVYVTASFGVATRGLDEKFEDVFKTADRAVYSVKDTPFGLENNSRNGVGVFGPKGVELYRLDSDFLPSYSNVI